MPLALHAAICAAINSAWDVVIFYILAKINTYIGYGNKGLVEGIQTYTTFF